MTRKPYKQSSREFKIRSGRAGGGELVIKRSERSKVAPVALAGQRVGESTRKIHRPMRSPRPIVVVAVIAAGAGPLLVVFH